MTHARQRDAKNRSCKSVDCDQLSLGDLIASEKSSNSDRKSSASVERLVTPILKAKRLISLTGAKEELSTRQAELTRTFECQGKGMTGKLTICKIVDEEEAKEQTSEKYHLVFKA